MYSDLHVSECESSKRPVCTYTCVYICTCRFECENNKRLHAHPEAAPSPPPPPMVPKVGPPAAAEQVRVREGGGRRGGGGESEWGRDMSACVCACA